jgi:ATP-dependent helicase/nuclease subunit A
MYTDEQKLILESKYKNIFVSAAAGSGKTFILVEKIIRLITHDNIDIDELLIVTFTETAVRQIRSRIFDALHKKLEEETNECIYIRLKKQIILLPHANIMTLHAFYIKLIKKYFYLVNVEPEFTIIDQQQSSILEKEVFKDIVTRKLKNNHKQFFKLIANFDNDFDKFRCVISNINAFSYKIPDQIQWLIGCKEKIFFDESKFILEETEWWKNTVEILNKIVNDIENCISKNILLCDKDIYLYKCREVLQTDLSFINNFRRSIVNGFNSTRVFFENNRCIRFCAHNKDDDLYNFIEMIQRDRKSYKKILKDIHHKIFSTSLDDFVEELFPYHRFMEEIINLVLEFNRKLTIKKFRLKMFNFDDLEVLALKIMQHNVEVKFKYILIDEFQDVNCIQKEIIDRIKSDNQFIVGDIKQSIYSFRNLYTAVDVNKKNINKNIELYLTANFRSTPKIIDAVNLIFKNIMTNNFSGIEYEKEKLKSSTRNKLNDDDVCELFLIESKENKYNKEQNVLLNEVNFIYNKIKSMGYDYKDVTILVRTNSSVEFIKNVFAKYNLPTTCYTNANDNHNFIHSREVILLVDFLKIIDNPRQEAALVSVLCSSIYNLSDKELLLITNVHNGDLYDCIRAYDGFDKFKDDIDSIRNSNVYNSIKKIINAIIYKTNFGKQLSKEFFDTYYEKFLYVVDSYIRQGDQRLFGFLRYINDLKNNDIKLEQEENLEINSVKIMTIHRSKGLEFPIVFIPFLGKKFFMVNTQDDLLIDSELGIGNKIYDTHSKKYINNFIYTAIKLKLKEKNLEEELKILYVAMTRAKKKLIMIGVTNSDNSCVTKYNAKNYLDWILPAVKSCSKKNDPIKLNFIKQIDCVVNSNELCNQIRYDINLSNINNNSNCVFKTKAESLENRNTHQTSSLLIIDIDKIFGKANKVNLEKFSINNILSNAICIKKEISFMLSLNKYELLINRRIVLQKGHISNAIFVYGNIKYVHKQNNTLFIMVPRKCKKQNLYSFNATKIEKIIYMKVIKKIIIDDHNKQHIRFIMCSHSFKMTR